MRKLKIGDNNYNIPSKWEELTVNQFDNIYPFLKQIEEEDIKTKLLVKIVCSIVNIEQPILLEAPKQLFNIILKELEFLWDASIEKYNPVFEIKIEGRVFKFPKEQTEISLGMFVDAEEILKGDRLIAGLLAILLQPDGQSYDSNIFSQRRELMGALPMSKAMPLINFFLQSKQKYTILLKLFLREKEQGLTHLSLLKKLVKNGDGITQLAYWQKGIYLKWIALLKSQLLRS